MNLSVLERIIILRVLPDEGNFLTMSLVRRLREDLSFSEEEHKLFEIHRDEKDRITWNTETSREKDVPMGDVATELIAKTFRDLDAQRKVTLEMLSLCEKFIPLENGNGSCRVS